MTGAAILARLALQEARALTAQDVTVESAARDYGVAVNGAEHEVDDSATGELRGRPPKARPYVHRGANGDMWDESASMWQRPCHFLSLTKPSRLARNWHSKETRCS